MHTGFVFSADTIAEETKQYIHENNLTMDVSNTYISSKWLLTTRVRDTIVKHVENDLRVEIDNDNITIQKPISPLTFGLFDTDLAEYTENQITFDNIIALVHAMFRGNWGIEVEVFNRSNPYLPKWDDVWIDKWDDVSPWIEEEEPDLNHDPNRWRISSVEFVKDDPIK